MTARYDGHADWYDELNELRRLLGTATGRCLDLCCGTGQYVDQLQRAHVELLEDGATVVHPTYRIAGWHAEAPYWRPGGVRSRVGMRHVPLAEFLTAFVAAGLTIEQVVEARPEDPVPHALGIRSRAAA